MSKIFFLLIIICQVSLSNRLIGQGVPGELTGVWKYQIEGLEGISIISPTHSAWILTKADRPNLHGKVLNNEEKVNAYNAVGSISILSQKKVPGNKRIASTHLLSNDPSRVGQSFSWDFEINGNFLAYWVIQSDGTRGYNGKARKLASWNAKTDWSKLNGLWKYINLGTGYYMHCGNYGLWLIINDPLLKVTTDEGKAHAYDMINSSAALVQNVDNRHQVWHVLHSFNENQENQSIYSGMKAINPDLYDVWMDDGHGKANDSKWQIQRVKN